MKPGDLHKITDTPERDGNGWTYVSTDTYSQTFQYQKAGGGTGSGTMTVTVHTEGGHKSAQVLFKKGPDPKPERRDGSQCRSCWAMGTNPYYDAKANDLPDTPKLATWQKIVLGVVAGVAAVVATAPVAIVVGEGCLATAPACAAEIAEMATGGASGGSLTAGAAGASFTWAGSKVRYSETATAIGDDANTIQNFMRSTGAKGHDVIVHGDEAGNFRVDGFITHPEQIAQLVRENPSYKGGPIQIVSCHAACGSAEELAEAMGVKITGASKHQVDLDPVAGTVREWPNGSQGDPVPWGMR
ncbi:hypothetical protein [Streptomyces sp. NPDC059371]|uniref:hypothetical protein n=1 Tax=Streptomyces sp. NPDC059371 TaxID=3346812 RepID=UPI0036A0604A